MVIGMAVTRRGIPVQVWCWPGNTADVTVMAQVRADLRDWKLTRVVWVTDRGLAPADNRRALQRGGGHCIQAEKLRSVATRASSRCTRAPSRARWPTGSSSATTRSRPTATPPYASGRSGSPSLDGFDALSATKRAELRGQIRTMPGLHRLLRVTAAGLPRIDRNAVRRQAHLDRKWLLRCSDPSLPD